MFKVVICLSLYVNFPRNEFTISNILVDLEQFQATSLRLYLTCIRNTLEAAMCLQVLIIMVMAFYC